MTFGLQKIADTFESGGPQAMPGPQPTELGDVSGNLVYYERLFNRNAKLTLFREGRAFNDDEPTGIEIENLRFKFDVQHSLSANPNTADVWIHNMTEVHRGQMAISPLSVQLEAGYDGINRLLATGDVHFAMSEIHKTDWVTLLQLNDLGRAFTFARVNKSYAEGTPARKILTDVAATMGLKLPSNLDNDTALDAGVVAGDVTYGSSQLELTRLLAPFGYHWSVQKGVLQILRDEEVRDGEALPIDEEHGMIGSPNFGSPPRSGKTPHITVKMLLYPEVSPGSVVEIKSRALVGRKGRFKVQKVRHNGDTHVINGWETTAEVLPL